MAGETILVVDDSRENREFIVQYILTPRHYRALQAHDGIEGLEIVRQHHPDVILLDLQMPRLDGRGVLEALRREDFNIPVILMTFHGSEEIAVEMFRLGVRDYVRKPYTPEEMASAIDGCLTEVRLRHEKESLTNRLMQANHELHTRVKELNTLYTIGKSVTALLNPAQLLTRIVDAAVTVSNAEQGLLILIENDKLVLRAAKRRGETQARAIAEYAHDVLAERAITLRKLIHAKHDDLIFQKQKGQPTPWTALAQPIIVGERIIGVLEVGNVTPDTPAFSEQDGLMLSALSDYAAIALENARNYHIAEAEKQAARSTLERFVPSTVVEKALQDEQLFDGRRDVSILYAELRGLGRLNVEQREAEQVINIVDDYIAAAVDTVLAHQGTILFVQGDSLLAIYNAPQEQADHIKLAARTATALQQVAVERRATYGEWGLGFAAGFATGEAVLGTVGSQSLQNYTAIGGVMKLSRHLGSLAESGQTLVAEHVVHILQISTRKLGETTVGGKPVGVFLMHSYE